MSSPRIPPVTHPTGAALAELDAWRSPDGTVPNVFATFAHHPALMHHFNALGGQLLFHGALSVRERELVILRVAARTHCDYELFHHERIARGVGLSDDEIEQVTAPEAPTELRVLTDVVDQLIATFDVNDQAWQAASARWSEPELIELIVMAGFYTALAGFLNSARIQIDTDSPTAIETTT